MTDRPTAEQLNAHLAAGGRVQVSTYLKSTVYAPKHAGMFSTGRDGALYVQRGRGKDCLSLATGRLLVAVTLHG